MNGDTIVRNTTKHFSHLDKTDAGFRRKFANHYREKVSTGDPMRLEEVWIAKYLREKFIEKAQMGDADENDALVPNVLPETPPSNEILSLVDAISRAVAGAARSGAPQCEAHLMKPSATST